MNEKEIAEFKEKVLKGISLAFKRLVEEKKKNNEELVFSQNGKIVHIKACDLK